MRVRPSDGVAFETKFPVVIIGGGACGLTAALTLGDAGSAALVLEQDPLPAGSTGLSSGFIPAAATRWQRERAVEDSVELMAGDIQAKARHLADAAIVDLCCRRSGPTLEWLADRHGIPFVLIEGFLYTGQSRARMHAVPERTGAALMARLLAAAEAVQADILCGAEVSELFADGDGRVRGVGFRRPDGGAERVACEALILACNGFGGNPDMVRQHIPEMAEAEYFGHAGNRGHAVLWGEALGAEARHMGAYQGHASVAVPHGILITWAVMREGGIQVNGEGKRFADESRGYSEHSVDVLAQPGGTVWDIYDSRIHALAMEFEDYRQAQAAGAVKRAADETALAGTLGLPEAALRETLALTRSSAEDPFGRRFDDKPALAPPYYAVKVGAALFHTQGGLAIDISARVLRQGGGALPNLFAGGGAACGVSGPEVWGYSSGNGLLTAVMLGRVAGESAAALVS
ncbi:MAG: FAD-dependent oxidoreductase [Alphaproteobacteria bacterium]|jgi:fumarate reductase flavoprotein subunit|nr:FAD-dependent oxidoreductase [Alphaproteobacteria bacterium]MDP6816873.1 FAD-dependent oxidoreductase [Alphaproteobacteria bacterium]